MQGKRDIEKFLKNKLDNLGDEYQDDWDVFEEKLSQASHLKRFRSGMTLAAASVALIFLFMGINVYQIFKGKNFYTPREETIVFDQPLFEEGIQPTETNKDDINSIASFEEETRPSVNSNASQGEAFNAPVSINNDFSDAVLSADEIADLELNQVDPTVIVSSEGSSRALVGLKSTSYKSVGSGADSDLFADDQYGDAAHISPGKEELVILNRYVIGELPTQTIGHGITSGQKRNAALTSELMLDALNFASMPTLRLPAPVKKVEREDTGPYVSPLQEKSKWGYSLNVYPNYTYRKFQVDAEKDHLLHRDFGDAVQAAESGGFSLNLGFEVSRRIGAVTYINTGVEYISYKTDVLYDFLNFRDASIDELTGNITGYTLKDEAERINFSDKNTYHYFNFPLSFSYQPWASDHVRLNIEAGASFMYFAYASGQTLNYKTLEVMDLADRDFKKSIGSLSFKVGANYFVSEKINIGFEPTLMYFTNTIYTDDYPFYVIPYSVGLNFNVQFKLN